MKPTVFILGLIGMACIAAIAVAAVHADASTRIAPMGDSITRGGDNAGSAYPSYRYHLWNTLRNGGYDVDFVGTTTDPTFAHFAFDQDHDGYSGYTTEILANDMDRILARVSPDVVLLDIGTNDVLQQVPMSDRMKYLDVIVDALRARNPNVRILIAQISPTGDTFRNEYSGLDEFNEKVAAYAQRSTSVASPIVVVDMNSAWSTALFTQADGVHPNNEGEKQLADRWANALVSTGILTKTGPTTGPTVVPSTPAGGATYAQARADYITAATAWGRAWGASDVAVIRQYLAQARAAFATCLATASQVNDPAHAADLAVVTSVSNAYIALADAAIAMYDGSDVYGTGRTQMNGGSYTAAGSSFQAGAERLDAAKTLFSQATSTLQSVSYAGTEFADGAAYTATIVPLLNEKATYVGEFATYARGWQHTALAYQARGTGAQATFQSEAAQAMSIFDSLRSSPSFGADAAANYDILAGMVPAGTATPR